MSRKKMHSVFWSDVAENDLAGIISTIARDSVQRAEEILDKLESLATGLESHAERGRVVPELGELGVRFYRELILKPWRLIYRVDGRDVFVVSVLDSRRNVEDLLLARFMR